MLDTAYLTAGDENTAIDIFNKSLAIDSLNAIQMTNTYMMLGELNPKRQDYDRALARFDKVKEYNNESAMPYASKKEETNEIRLFLTRIDKLKDLDVSISKEVEQNYAYMSKRLEILNTKMFFEAGSKGCKLAKQTARR